MMNLELGNKLNAAETSIELGILYNNLNETNKSSEYFKKAKAYYKKQGSLKKVREIELFSK